MDRLVETVKAESLFTAKKMNKNKEIRGVSEQ